MQVYYHNLTKAISNNDHQWGIKNDWIVLCITFMCCMNIYINLCLYTVAHTHTHAQTVGDMHANITHTKQSDIPAGRSTSRTWNGELYWSWVLLTSCWSGPWTGHVWGECVDQNISIFLHWGQSSCPKSGLLTITMVFERSGTTGYYQHPDYMLYDYCISCSRVLLYLMFTFCKGIGKCLQKGKQAIGLSNHSMADILCHLMVGGQKRPLVSIVMFFLKRKCDNLCYTKVIITLHLHLMTVVKIIRHYWAHKDYWKFETHRNAIAQSYKLG